MPKFNVAPESWITVEQKGEKLTALSEAALKQFSTDVLGLGDITARSKPTDCIAAVFDLAGFTNFCKQIEPQLSVPHYLNKYLSWLIDQIKKETIKKNLPKGSTLWHSLPFFLKFTGDGLLLLWNCDGLSETAQRNIIVSLCKICDRYENEFVKTLSEVLVDTPPSLRCGIARGTVFSVGNESDYIGSCINMAARIQKLPGVSFAFNRRGFDLENHKPVRFFKEDILIKKVQIRGIGESELIAILKSDFEKMKKDDLAFYQKP